MRPRTQFHAVRLANGAVSHARVVYRSRLAALAAHLLGPEAGVLTTGATVRVADGTITPERLTFALHRVARWRAARPLDRARIALRYAWMLVRSRWRR